MKTKTVDILPPEVPRVVINQLKKDDACIIEPQLQNKSLYITGPAGAGKSHQAVALMLILMKSSDPMRYPEFAWRNVPKLLYELRQSFTPSVNGKTEKEIVDYLINVEWLCLDDLGVEKTTDWVLQTLYLIINERYENERTTVFTSNMSLKELSEKMGDDRLSSRISGMCQIIKMEGKDKRD